MLRIFSKVVFDWCCLYYFRKKQSGTFTGGSMCSNPFFRCVNIGFLWHFLFWFFCVCARPLSLTKGGGLGLWLLIYHLESTVVRGAPALTLYERVFLSFSPHTGTLCPMFSLDPSVVGLEPPCTYWRKGTITWLCTSHTCVAWSAKSLSFFPSCTSFWV